MNPVFKGAVFDLDGLLIDSEPVWRWAQVITLGEAGGILTESRQLETTGLGLDAALALWRKWFPEAVLHAEPIGRRLQELALGRIAEAGVAKPGALKTLDACRRAHCMLAVASSSSPVFIRTALTRMGVQGHFQELVSAEEVAHGKPHPAVYLEAARRLGFAPAECIAFEDSLHGLRAAKAAGMFCVGVPAAHHRADPGFGIADIALSSLEEFRSAMLSRRPVRAGSH